MEGDERRRKRFSFGFRLSDLLERFLAELERELEKAIPQIPEELIRERRLPDGSVIREAGPLIWGYSVKVGADGKPQVRVFGNVKPSVFGMYIDSEREPLIDVVESDKNVIVVVELPGVDKKDIFLSGTDDSLTISVNTSEYKYFKTVNLPCKVIVEKARAKYKNGVLEITLPKKKKSIGEKIDIT